MFKIDFSLFICYYLSVQILIFFLLWLFEKKTTLKLRPMAGEQVWQCGICLYVYFESKPSKISTCPLCGSLNQKTKQAP